MLKRLLEAITRSQTKSRYGFTTPRTEAQKETEEARNAAKRDDNVRRFIAEYDSAIRELLEDFRAAKRLPVVITEYRDRPGWISAHWIIPSEKYRPGLEVFMRTRRYEGIGEEWTVFLPTDGAWIHVSVEGNWELIAAVKIEFAQSKEWPREECEQLGILFNLIEKRIYKFKGGYRSAGRVRYTTSLASAQFRER